MKKKIKLKSPPVFIVSIVIKLTDFLKRLRIKLLPPQVVLIEYTVEYLIMQRCVNAAAELFLSTLLEDGPRSIEYLAEKTGMNCNSLYRVMRALTCAGIFKEKKGRIFENNKLSKCLLYGKENTVTALAKFTGAEWMVKLWSDLLYSIEKEKNLYKIKYGKGFFEWLEENPEEYRIFDEGMTSLSALSDVPIASAYNFSSFNSIVDVGGGHGSQIATILKAYPKMKGMLFDIERVVDGSKGEDHFKDDLLAGRVEFVAGDFFKSVPAGCDAYLMKSVIHDWDDAGAIKILTNCRKAMHENSKLLVADMVVKGYNKPHFSKLLDIAMLVLVEGKERTKEEFENIFEKSGFKLKRIIPTASPYSIIEGVPI
jgi:DNA-binding Lrp family transcriptional regulator